MNKVSLLIVALLCVGIVVSGGNSIIPKSDTNSVCMEENFEMTNQFPLECSADKLEIVEADCGCWRHLIECGGARPLTQCIRDYLDCVLTCDI